LPGSIGSSRSSPEFHSSEYGLLYLCFALLDGAAFAILMGLASGHRIGATKGYSALLLSVILLWTYVHAMQYIVIWAGNIPDEAVWYIKRSSNGWQFVLVVVALGQFVFPFFALLSSRVRSTRSWLLALCGLTLLMRCWEASILILPAIEHIAPLTRQLDAGGGAGVRRGQSVVCVRTRAGQRRAFVSLCRPACSRRSRRVISKPSATIVAPPLAASSRPIATV